MRSWDGVDELVNGRASMGDTGGWRLQDADNCRSAVVICDGS
jgi:hypothetical protein